MIEEGLCVQMLHQGPYAKEGESIAKMKAFAGAKGLALHGLHHEIYFPIRGACRRSACRQSFECR